MNIGKNINTILKSPLITEKTSRDSFYRKYAFEVDSCANKIEIKHAVEKIYNVKVQNVASVIIKGKTKRLRWNQPGKTTAWKKAIVTLKKGFEIKMT